MVDRGILTSWRQIALYLGVSVRTAKRYYYDLHMPIHRGLGSVKALPPEIDGWLRTYTKNNFLLHQNYTNLSPKLHANDTAKPT